MKVLILSTARSGSTYFTKLLYKYSLQNTFCCLEPFGFEIISNLQDQDRYVRSVNKRCLTYENVILKTHLNLPLAKKARVEVVMEEKTPYNIINILNIKKLEEIFNKRMTSFSSNSILNKNGILELK